MSVVTGHIARFDVDGITLQDGSSLKADIVVVATGLQLNVLADVAVHVDGQAFVPGHALAYKGITPARLASIDFSEPIMISGGATFTRPGLLPSADLRQFDGMRVVTTRHGPLWRHLQTEHPALQFLPAEHYQQALEMVLRGEADLAALNMHAGRAIAQRLFPGQLGLPQLPYMPLRTGFALRRGAHPELLLRFNAALAAARADGRWQAVHDHWVR